MTKSILLILTLIATLQITACGKETDPKKAFENGDYKTAFTLWMPLAESGDADAQNYMGILYYLGFGVQKDYKKSLEWYERAAKAGHADAQRNYGDMINFGRGIQRSNQEAYKWYFAASQQGNQKAARQIEVLAASGNLSPNQQMHAKIEANEFILNEDKRFMSHDTYINKK
ncbi:MAG: TPR repeat protein [Gammaproteobacteria bacterium]|jgi:TPR repeat protein